ncbi:MAG: hypothetical protein RPR28_10680 [Cycloclasticus sp.]|nr:hypothetical protein A9Q80_03270 [Cycloclasticus sp. 46_83_sub15_T18]OUR81475.1 hypothetical protein A9Q82_10115 [Cycloclasticus sp. 46_120_T64]
MNEKTIKALVDAGAVKKVQIVAHGAAIHVNIVTKNDVVTATTLKGSIKIWATIDACAKWVKNLGIGRVQLVMDKWLPAQKGLNL